MNDGAPPLGILGLSVVSDKMHVCQNTNKTLQKHKQMAATLLKHAPGTGEAPEGGSDGAYDFTDEVSR